MKREEGFLIAVLLVPTVMIIVSVWVVALEKNEMQRVHDLYKDHNMTTAKVTR